MTLSEIIDDVAGSGPTLTIYDATDPSAVDDIEDHFAVQNATVERASAPAGPDDFAVLHDDGEFVAASDLDDLHAAVTFDAGLLDAGGFDEVTHPDVLKHVSDTTFAAYGKRRMVLASREIEERAWRARGGELHAGFQRLSLLAEQWDLYTRLADRGVDVHVYGEADWRPPETDRMTVHAGDDPELLRSWFVAFEAPDGGDCTLVADERDPDAFRGFWSYDSDLVADVFAHLRAEYAADAP